MYLPLKMGDFPRTCHFSGGVPFQKQRPMSSPPNVTGHLLLKGRDTDLQTGWKSSRSSMGDTHKTKIPKIVPSWKWINKFRLFTNDYSIGGIQKKMNTLEGLTLKTSLLASSLKQTSLRPLRPFFGQNDMLISWIYHPTRKSVISHHPRGDDCILGPGVRSNSYHDTFQHFIWDSDGFCMLDPAIAKTQLQGFHYDLSPHRPN